MVFGPKLVRVNSEGHASKEFHRSEADSAHASGRGRGLAIAGTVRLVETFKRDRGSGSVLTVIVIE